MSSLGSNVSSLRPASRGNQKKTWTSSSVKHVAPFARGVGLRSGLFGGVFCFFFPSPPPPVGGFDPSSSSSSSFSGSVGGLSSSPNDPSASFSAQNRKNAIAFNATSGAQSPFVKAMRQLTQSVNVVASVSVMC